MSCLILTSTAIGGHVTLIDHCSAQWSTLTNTVFLLWHWRSLSLQKQLHQINEHAATVRFTLSPDSACHFQISEEFYGYRYALPSWRSCKNNHYRCQSSSPSSRHQASTCCCGDVVRLSQKTWSNWGFGDEHVGGAKRNLLSPYSKQLAIYTRQHLCVSVCVCVCFSWILSWPSPLQHHWWWTLLAASMWIACPNSTNRICWHGVGHHTPFLQLLLLLTACLFSGVATTNNVFHFYLFFVSPTLHFNYLHILLHCIHTSHLWPTSSPPTW